MGGWPTWPRVYGGEIWPFGSLAFSVRRKLFSERWAAEWLYVQGTQSEDHSGPGEEPNDSTQVIGMK